MEWNEGIEGSALEIAASRDSLIRVQAGPGTGKSFSLRRRVARLLVEGNDPERILLVTFTRVSARDLERELDELSHPEVSRVRKGTLHALCFSMLNQANVFEFTHRIPRPLLTFEERFLLEDLALSDGFGNYYERRTRLRAFEAAWAREKDQEPGWPEDETDRRFQGHLEEWLRFNESMLIGELIPVSLNYLRSNPSCPELDLFDHVLVDEYQDLNRAEQSLIDLISSRGKLVIVGDEDQSIYEHFRYAHPEGISDFHDTHEGTLDIPLDRSRRCPRIIVEVANSLIHNNLRRTGRVLLPYSEDIHGEIQVIQWLSMEEEAQGIANYIGTMIDAREFEAGKILVLCPRRQFGYEIRDILRERGYPAHSFFHEESLDGNPKDLEKCQAQEAFTLLSLIVNPDDRVSLRCWLGFGSPSLRVGEFQRLREYCSDRGCSPREALDSMVRGEVSIRHTTGIVNRYRDLLNRTNDISTLPLSDIIDRVFPTEEEWAEPFRLVIQENTDDESPSDVLETVRTSIIQPELPRDVEYIRIMSLHKSKGLNADLVIICGCVEGLLPSRRGDLSFEQERRFLEEQRRLFYVGITRARRTLIISSILSLPRDLAHKMGAEIQGGDEEFGNTIASTFILELGPNCPRPIMGTEWEYAVVER